jgi:hypothetical protein
MIENLREAELAVYNLVNAERRLSEEGIDVTPKGLQETIDAVRELVPILSQIQAEELVSEIATKVAPSLRLTNEQIQMMSESIALLYVRNKALGVSFDEVKSQLTGAFLTGRVSQGINDLGVKLSEQIVLERALADGLVETEEAFKKLTGEQQANIKATAMLSIVHENASQDIQTMGEYMETTDGQISRASTAWNDFLTSAGKVFGPVIAQGAEMVAHSLELVVAVLEKTGPLIEHIIALTVAWVKTTKDMPQYFKFGGGALFAENFKKNFEEIKESFRGLDEVADTPTASVEEFQDAIESIDASALEKVGDIFQDTANDIEDLAQSLFRKLDDLDKEYQRKAIDAQIDYNRKVEDINLDYEREREELLNKQRSEDLKAEKEYQLKLWELRQRFLMDLEDALHARDARQVLRLIKQFNFDKEALKRKKKIDDEARKENQRAELEALEAQRQHRLEDAKREYEQKLADQQVAKQREIDDLNQWYLREFEDLQEAQDRKIKELLAGWAKEQQITEENAAAVYAILQKYFGPGGYTDELYQYMMQSMVASTQGAITAGIDAMNSAFSGVLGTVGTNSGSSTGVSNTSNLGTGSTNPQKPGRDEGLIPTSLSKNLGSPIPITPLNQIGKSSESRSSGSRSGNDVNGQIKIAVDLSPDLQGRIVEQSMNGVADVIARVNRSK